MVDPIMHHLLVFALMICSSHSWMFELKSSHKEILIGVTKNVTLECDFSISDSRHPVRSNVTRLRILKLHGGIQVPETYADLNRHQSRVIRNGVGPGVSFEGYMANDETSFLTITWSVASETTAGRYACEVQGHFDDGASFKTSTEPVSINRSQLSLEYLLSKFLDTQGQTEKIQQSVQTVRDDLDTLKKDFNVIQKTLKKIVPREELNSIVDSKIRVFHKGHWPGGRYALLRAHDGCPSSDTSVWLDGSIFFHLAEFTGAYGIFDLVSSPPHSDSPLFFQNGTDNFAFISTCGFEYSVSGPAWPKGSYCIHGVRDSCPGGFEEARLQLDAVKAYRPAGNARSKAEILFCCRNDDIPTRPMDLPVDSPFYLYRNKGTCQQVNSAKVSEEQLRIDTKRSVTEQNLTTGAFPDFTLNPLTFELCYYSLQ